MSQPFNPSPSAANNQLFPSAVICTCGEQFRAGARSLSLYLAHTCSAVASQTQSSSKPHRIKHSEVFCAFCPQSIGIDLYRTHLTECHDDEQTMAAIRRYRLANRSGALPSYECERCLDDDRFLHLDVGTVLEHSHEDAPPLLELYVTCRECACRVAVDNAIGHASFAHRERFLLTTALDDMFFTEPDQTLASDVRSDCGANLEEQNSIDSVDIPDPVFIASESRRNGQRNSLTPAIPETHGRRGEAGKRRRRRPFHDVQHFSHDEWKPPSLATTQQSSPATIGRLVGSTAGPAVDPAHYFTEEAFSEQSAMRDIGVAPETSGRNGGFNSIVLTRHVKTRAQSRAAALRSHLSQRIAIRVPERVVLGYECDECGKTFEVLQQFLRHQRCHSGKQRYVCGQCGKVVSTFHSLQGHQRTHTGERPFVCSDCGRRFALASTLTKHHRVAHTGEGEFTCSACERRFQEPDKLAAHRCFPRCDEA